MVAAGPAPFVALLAGWIVTEVGRQPWIVYRVMRVPEALTSQTGLATYLYATAVIYLVLAVALVAILRRNRPGRHPARPGVQHPGTRRGPGMNRRSNPVSANWVIAQFATHGS